MPPSHLVLLPEERDKKGITGILSLFSLQASRHLLGLRLVIPLLMFFIPYKLYLYGMFLMKKGCLPGPLFVGEAHAKE